MGRKAVFLDRDGTIVEDVNYCSRVEDLHILPGVAEAIKLLNRDGFKVVVITNQSGIGRGYFNENTLAQIHGKMHCELSKHGAKVDLIYYCPHHPDDGCECRKPKISLFLQAAKKLDIDIGRSSVVGDRQMDIDAAKTLGCKSVLVTTGPLKAKDITDPPDFTAGNLLEAARWIIRETN